MSFHETVYLFGGIISDFGTEESNSVSIYEHDAWVIQGISDDFEILGLKFLTWNFILEQSMRVPRDGHTSVVQGEYIIHIGGSGDKVRPKIWVLPLEGSAHRAEMSGFFSLSRLEFHQTSDTRRSSQNWIWSKGQQVSYSLILAYVSVCYYKES